MTTRQAVAVAAAVTAVALLAGGSVLLARGPRATVASVGDAVTPSPEPSPESSPTPTPDPQRVAAIRDAVLPSPVPTPTPSPTATETAEPEPSYPVAQVQRKLDALGYYRGPVDGAEGAAMTTAVMAFQKVQGISVDGVVGPQTLQALEDPAVPELRSGPGTRIEIDLTKQVLYWIRGGELAEIFPVSSGSGEPYTTSSGSTAYSLTPAGWYEIERRIDGVRDAPLGILYDPMYFYRGWAIHGSNSVPAYPASHGCVRLPRPDARWLFDRAPNGTPVHLYGGEHTFQAGSPAPGTDTPAGDTNTDPQPQPSTPPPNEAPVAEDDAATVRVGGRITVDVLANDRDDAGLGQARLQIARSGSGQAVVADRAVRYHAPDTAGTDRFTYRLCDDQGACDTATVTVRVRPAPTPSPSGSPGGGLLGGGG